jgi:hypothetical protein
LGIAAKKKLVIGLPVGKINSSFLPLAKKKAGGIQKAASTSR